MTTVTNIHRLIHVHHRCRASLTNTSLNKVLTDDSDVLVLFSQYGLSGGQSITGIKALKQTSIWTSHLREI